MASSTSTSEKIKESAGSAIDAAKQTARDAADAAKTEAQARVEGARDDVAAEMHDTASALRRAADEVRDGSPQGSTFSYLATGLADMADSVKDQDVSDVVGIVNTFARRNPVAFLGGAAVLGFAATRFAKASESRQRHAEFEESRQVPRPSAHSTTHNPNMTGEARSND